MHGGSISAHSEGEGLGSVFTVVLPVKVLGEGTSTSLSSGTSVSFHPVHPAVVLKEEQIRGHNGTSDETMVLESEIREILSTRILEESDGVGNARGEVKAVDTVKAKEAMCAWLGGGETFKQDHNILSVRMNGDFRELSVPPAQAVVPVDLPKCGRRESYSSPSSDTLRKKSPVAVETGVLNDAIVSEVELPRIPRAEGGKVDKDESWKPRVLVVDDVAMNRRIILKVLKSRSGECAEAADGLEAVNMVQRYRAENRPFDVITMDYQMPVMDGPTATKLIKESGFKGVIIGLTGNVLEADMETFTSHGADIVLTKPLDVQLYDNYLISARASLVTGMDMSENNPT